LHCLSAFAWEWNAAGAPHAAQLPIAGLSIISAMRFYFDTREYGLKSALENCASGFLFTGSALEINLSARSLDLSAAN
jgi:hypothetical protein